MIKDGRMSIETQLKFLPLNNGNKKCLIYRPYVYT